MITIEVNKKEIKIPQSWDEISFNEYCKISKLEGLDIIAYFLGMTKEELEQYTHINNFQLVNTILDFLKTPPTAKPLKHIVFNGKKYNAELEVLDMCIGQYKDSIQLTTADMDNDTIKLIVATYLQPTLDNDKYDSSRVDKLADEIANQLSVQDYLNIQGFFLQRLMRSKSGTKRTYSLLNILKKKILQVYLIWKFMASDLVYQAYAIDLTPTIIHYFSSTM